MTEAMVDSIMSGVALLGFWAILLFGWIAWLKHGKGKR